jgi:cell division initiation protein
MARKTAADKVRAKTFPIGLRGYDREAVDAWRDDVAKLVGELESQAPRDTAVKRALEEVGQETASILQRAHEAAEELTTRSRSQAEGRLQRAEAEAEEAIRQAEERAQQLEVESRGLWEQRTRLLEEMRQLADEVLAVADDAAERIDPPAERGPSGATTDEVPVAEPEADTQAGEPQAAEAQPAEPNAGFAERPGS